LLGYASKVDLSGGGNVLLFSSFVSCMSVRNVVRK